MHTTFRTLTLALSTLLVIPLAGAQVFTVTTEQVEGRYLQFQPTHVDLPKMHAGPFTWEALERTLASEQGYAMRPLPLASKGLTLVANGALTPAGSDYVDELHKKGVAVRPGDRVTVTKILFHNDRLVLELNGGPDAKHKYLSHLQVGTGYAMTPVAKQGEVPTGSRLTLIFPGGVPNVTGDEVKALIAPIVGFGEKSPQQAYAETLPPLIRNAVLEHRLLVGMNSDMVLHAKGAPVHRFRENNESGTYEEWVYGTPPQDSTFVRFQGNRVMRIELASVGQTPEVRTANEVGGYWQSEEGIAQGEQLVRAGDPSERDRIAENSPSAPPTLRKPGEALPQDKDTNHPTMGPVQFPEKPQP